MELNSIKAGTKASFVSIGSNCLLTILNIVVGFMGGSYALVAEGMHSFTDIITSIIAYAGFKISQRPPDERFPTGYGRAEALAGLFIVIFLTFVSFEIMDIAHEKLDNPSLITIPDNYVIIMAILGIVIHFIVSRYLIKIGREVNSASIEAEGQHQRIDIYTSLAILIGVTAARMGFPMLDPLIGFFIGILILKIAYDIGKKNILNIMGHVPDNEEIISKIKAIVNGTPNAKNAHNIKIDNYSSYLIVTLHIQVDEDLEFRDAYDISCQVEQKILTMPEIKYVSVKPCLGHDNHDV